MRPRGARRVTTPPRCFDSIGSHSALSVAGNDDQRFAHLWSIIYTETGREEFGRGMPAFYRRIIDEPDAFPPEFRRLFLRSSFTMCGGKLSPGSLGHVIEKAISSQQELCDSGGLGGRRSIERRGSLGSWYPEEWSIWD